MIPLSLGPFDSSDFFFFFFIRFHQLYWKMGWGLIGRWVGICQTLSHAQRPWLPDIMCAAGFGHGEKPKCSLLGKNLWISVNTRIKFFLTCIATHTGEWESAKGRYDY